MWVDILLIRALPRHPSGGRTSYPPFLLSATPSPNRFRHLVLGAIGAGDRIGVSGGEWAGGGRRRVSSPLTSRPGEHWREVAVLPHRISLQRRIRIISGNVWVPPARRRSPPLVVWKTWVRF